MTTNLEIETADGIRSIAISRPEKRNSLSCEVLTGLAAALREADADGEVRAVLLHGLPNIFSSGADLVEIIEEGKTAEAIDGASALISAADQLKKPLIACVNGPAVGLAVTLLMSCDLVYCGEHALFSIPAAALGETPLFGLTARLINECGYHLAAEKLLLSEPITAEQAQALHIVNGVFEDDKVLREATARALRLCRMPPQAVLRTKALLKSVRSGCLAEQSRRESEVFREQSQETECAEAHRAFIEGRRPDFSPKAK